MSRQNEPQEALYQFGHYLFAQRVLHKLSIEQVAKASGLRPRTVRLIEAGSPRVRFGEVLKLTNFYRATTPLVEALKPSALRGDRLGA